MEFDIRSINLTSITGLNNQTGSAQSKEGQTIGSFIASLVSGLIVAGVQFLLFLLIKDKNPRIYQPKTYLVPERERTSPVNPGLWQWIRPIFKSTTNDFLQKCGLDAYFFLRFLYMLLKIFVPMTLLLIPILIPINYLSGNEASGLDKLTISNVPYAKSERLWAHCLMAIVVVFWTCYTFFIELKRYIRVRQSYMTSPQHRLRASATTVLVRAIPAKWLSVEALEGLFDVYPGGLRNIWINRNYDDLNEKIEQRDKLAQTLETAETELIRKCWNAHLEKMKKEAKAAKKSGGKIPAHPTGSLWPHGSEGISSGDPHQVHHTVREALHRVTGSTSSSSSSSSDSDNDEKLHKPIPVIGAGLEAVAHGLDAVGKTVVDGFRRTGTKRHKRKSGESKGTDHNSRPSEDAPSGSGDQADDSQLPKDKSWRTFKKPNTVQSSKSLEESEEEEKRKKAKDSDKEKVVVATKDSEPVENPPFNSQYDNDEGGDEEPQWKQYMKPKDRETMRIPIFGWNWMPSLPLIGKKVDTIYYCRKEVARLNAEIEEDQADPEKFPLMNSAFIQFNNQAAAHMACQSVSHHIPKQMTPRIVEIAPNDVVWENMSIPWWQQYIRTAGILTVVIIMIILWAIPVAFSGTLSNISTVEQYFPWLNNWLGDAPDWVISMIQGILPVAVLAMLVMLLPMILRFLVKLQGIPTGMLIELSVQKYYFAFQFVQIFLVVSISRAISTLLSWVEDALNNSSFDVSSVPEILAENIPKSSNYFLSYMLLQALSVSSGALVQVMGLFGWFVLGPMNDTTGRSKYDRLSKLSEIKWGTFYPVYTNLACIGFIYSILSPLILVFNVITFSLFWFVYRYNTLYVYRYRVDTGGLLFPRAVNQLFTGLYIAELVLIGYFLVIEAGSSEILAGQIAVMILLLIGTVIFQLLLNDAFAPLFQYLPITLEDDAVIRDEEYAAFLEKRHSEEGGNVIFDQKDQADQRDNQDISKLLEEEERRSLEQDREIEAYEMQQVETEKKKSEANRNKTLPKTPDRGRRDSLRPPRRNSTRSSWADRSPKRRASSFGTNHISPARVRTNTNASSAASKHDKKHSNHHRHKSSALAIPQAINPVNLIVPDQRDIEAQRNARSKLTDMLFTGIADELEDLTPEQRDALVQRAFLHSALRAKRPVIWVPRDTLGVSDDEVTRTSLFSKNIWISNKKQTLNEDGDCELEGAPPDFDEVDLIQL